MGNKVIEIHVDMYRSADITQVCVVDDETWKKIQFAKEEGISIYLGEVAGKHSEVSVILSDDNLSVLSESESDCEVLTRLIGGSTGVDIVGMLLEKLEDYEDGY